MIYRFHKDLMLYCACQPVPLLFDLNVVITNLNKISKEDGCDLVEKVGDNIKSSLKTNEEYAVQYADIPLVGRTIFEQQRRRAEEVVNNYSSLALLFRISILHGVTAVELLIIHKKNGGSDYAE